jgi:hypothetical protein
MASAYTENALMLWEAMLSVDRIREDAPPPGFREWWEREGTSVVRSWAAGRGAWLESVWVALNRLDTEEVIVGCLSFDWEVVPAILWHIEWSDDVPTLPTPAKLARALIDAEAARQKEVIAQQTTATTPKR